ncbi:MAG: hypothetical protein AB1540_01965 [Bdellovibrionota bacterium]
MNFETLIESFGDDIRLHARLVNTFSFMEYIGARKIMKSQIEDRISESLLSHMAEEIRHAQVLKRLALKMSGGELGSYTSNHILGGHAAHEYMQAVDRGASDILATKDTWLAYTCATWLIEERAMRVYPSYEATLERLGFSGYLRGILRDEEKHLADVRREMTLPAGSVTALLALETSAFDRFLSCLPGGLGAKPSDELSGADVRPLACPPQATHFQTQKKQDNTQTKDDQTTP